jgi:hypothetical protein
VSVLRQRVRVRRSPLVVLDRVLVLLFGLALIWYGLMLLLLALKTPRDTVESLSGYRAAFDWLAGLQPSDVDGGVTRAIVAGVGLVAFVVFGYAAFKQLPRPRLTRTELRLAGDDRGTVDIGPRALERLAEAAAGQEPAVESARGRYETDDLAVNVTVRRAHGLADALAGVQRRVAGALEEHDLPSMPVNVTLTGFDRRHRRDLR